MSLRNPCTRIFYKLSKASRRYISNPNRLCAWVLAATASPTQAPPLFDFIDRYLNFEISIYVHIDVGPLICFWLKAYVSLTENSRTMRARHCAFIFRSTRSESDHIQTPVKITKDYHYEDLFKYPTCTSEEVRKTRRGQGGGYASRKYRYLYPSLTSMAGLLTCSRIRIIRRVSPLKIWTLSVPCQVITTPMP